MSTATLVEDLKATRRYIRHNAVHAITDIYDALVELITNSDDSYNRMGTSKRLIRIEVDRRRGGKSSYIIVKDRAEGMDLEQLKTKLGSLGERMSAKSDRGFMARGAKDLAALGDVMFESIKDGKYSWLRIRKDFRIEYPARSSSVTDSIREKMGIPRGNGTMVTLEVEHQHQIPQHDTLVQLLPRHFALRDILLEDSGTKVELQDLSSTNPRCDRVISSYPSGKEIVNERFEVPGYPGVTFAFELYKSTEPFLDDNPSSRFRRGGILIKDVRAIHDISYLDRHLENDPHAQYYFGKITCPYIRDLCEEYDRLVDIGQPLPANNPTFILDPNRKSGLEKNHPFMKAVSEITVKILRGHIEKDKTEEKRKERTIESDATKERLKRLAKAASSFLKDKLVSMDEFAKESEASSAETLAKLGVAIFPEYAKMETGEIRTFIFRVVLRPHINYDDPVFINADSDSVQILNPEIKLYRTKNEKFLYGKFQIKALKETDKDPVGISAKFDGFGEAIAFIKIVAPGSMLLDLPTGLSFEKASYSIEESKKRKIRIFADLKHGFSLGEQVALKSENQKIVILGRPPVLEAYGKQVDIGLAEFDIVGRQHGITGKIEAKIQKTVATTKVSVKEKDEDEGIPMDIKLSDKEMGSFRAQWDVPDNPNVLLVSATHPTVSRYLGPAPSYEGQETRHFKLLIAEIVAERICQRVMETRASLDSRAFNSEDGFDIQAFYLEHNKIMTEFAPIAHKILFSDTDLTEQA